MKNRLLSLLLSLLLITSVFSATFINANALGVDKNTNLPKNTGKTYYIDADNGNDKSTGLSESLAWKTLNNVNNTEFEPGSAILLKRGCSWTDTLLWPKGTGDENNQNYISCYGDVDDDLPYISSTYSDKISGLPDADTCLYIKGGQNYWTIENLQLNNGTDGTGNQTIVSLNGASNNRMKGVILRNCVLQGSNPNNWSVVSKSGLGGISVVGGIDNVLLESNEIYNVKGTGIGINGWSCGVNYKGEPNLNAAKGVVIRNNYLENIGKDGVITNNCYKPLVEYNVCNKAHSYAKNTAHVAFWPFATYAALFQYNEAYNTKTIYDGQGFDCDYLCYDTTFQYNYSHDNDGGFMLICTEAKADWMSPQYAYNVGSTVRYNISQNEHHYVFSLIDGIQNTRIYNNTVYAGRNVDNATNLFFSYDKGENMLTKLHYADDLLVANNLFYLDTMRNGYAANCTNVVWKNNVFSGYARNNGPANGTVTYRTKNGGSLTTADATEKVYEYKEVSGNLYSTDALMVNPGVSGIGMDTCDGYMLYEGSPAIGTGIAIEDGLYPCTTDFFGNKIDNSNINIGAYAGKGVKRPTHTYDNKYEKMLDFENEEVGSIGTGTYKVNGSGIIRCLSATGNPIISDNKNFQNSNTSSTKSLALTNSDPNTANTVKAEFYIYGSELQNSNGIRMWLDPAGKTTNYTVSFKVTNSLSYIKTITVYGPGWYYFTFNEKYAYSNNERVTPEIMRKMQTITISANVAANKSVYVDDIQSNNGEMDEEDTPQKLAFEPADITLIEDFETEAEISNQNNPYGWRGSGPSSNFGIKVLSGSKAFFCSSISGVNTGTSSGFGWKPAFDKLKAALKDDSKAEGIQMKMPTLATASGVEITDEEKYNCNNSYGKYTISISSTNGISFFLEDGTQKTVTSLKYAVEPDKNENVRIPFNKLFFNYDDTINGTKTTITKYLNEFSETEIQNYLYGLTNFSISYSTYGGTLKKELTINAGIDDIAIYKNVEHDVADWQITKDATCTEKGYEQIICNYCKETIESKDIDALGHNMQWVISKNETCTEDGEKVLKCSRCGEQTETQVIPATGHNLETEVIPPTCTKEGYTIQKCKNCDYQSEKTNIVAATGHQHTVWIVDKEASCTENGTCYLECLDCKQIIETGITKANHKFVKTVIAPTCTNQGYTHYKCEACSKEFNMDYVPPKGHINGGFTTDKPATYFETGIKSKHCKGCNGRISITTIAKKVLATPSIKLSTKKKQITVKWNKVSDATSYIVYIKKGNSYKKSGQTAKLNFTVKKLKSKTKYSFAVKAVITKGGKTAYSSVSSVKSIKAK